MKKYTISAEVNMDASHYETVTVEANTDRNAIKFAIDKLKLRGYFHIANISIVNVERK